MYLDLMDILRAPGTSLERAIDLGPVALDDVNFVDRIHGHVKAANARRSIVISGQASSEVEMRCSRCLQVFAQPLDMELEAVAPVSFFRAAPNTVIAHAKSPRSGDEESGEDEDELDDETAAIFDAHSVDVLELLRQAAVLAWPIQPLCSEDCAGLPEATLYKITVGDDRWSALRALAQPSGDESGDEVDRQAEQSEADAGWDEELLEEDLAGDEPSDNLLDEESRGASPRGSHGEELRN